MRLLALSLLLGLVAQDYPPAFPRPTAAKLLETDRIVVWDVVWPRGDATPLHRHVFDQVGTYYQAGGRVITSLDGTRRSAATPVGNLSTTRRGTTHVEEGATDPPLRAVFIELKHDGPSGLAPVQSADPPSFPRDGARVLLDDDRVTVWDYRWQPGDAPRRAVHDRSAIWVFLEPGTLRITPANGEPALLDVTPGRVRSLERGASETDEAIAGTPRVMVFAFK
jgi:hypothetical protein